MCCCGGHNSSNPKSNVNHNATKTKLNRRMRQKFILLQKLKLAI